MAHDVFVSYPHPDKAVADAVVHTLEARGVRCWVAPRDVIPGGDWAAEIVGAIDDCRLMVVVFSDATNRSEHIVREVRAAAEAHKPIVPFRTDDVEPSGALRYYLGGTHWLDALTGPLEEHLTELTALVASMTGEGDAVVPDTPVVRPVDSISAALPDEPDPGRWRRVPRWARIATVATAVAVVVALAVTVVSSSDDGEPPAGGGTDDEAPASDDSESAVTPDPGDPGGGEAFTIALANGGVGGGGPNLVCRISESGEECVPVGPGDVPGAEDVAVADFDGDGRLDLALAVLGDDPSDPETVYVAPREQLCIAHDGGYDCSAWWEAALPSTTITAADVNGDGAPDLFVGGFSSLPTDGGSKPVPVASVCANDRVAAFSCSTLPLAEAGAEPLEVYALTAADMDGDGNTDVVVGGNGPNHLCRGNGAGGWTCVLIEEEPSETRDTAVADIDEDGNLDVVVANWQTPNRLCLGDGAGGFECTDFTTADNPSTSIAVGDIDGDGHLDVVLGRGLAARDEGEIPDHRCLGDGTGALTCSEIPVSGDPTNDVLLADTNGDGDLDFLRFGESNELCLGDGAGNFGCRGLDLGYQDDRGFSVVGGFSSAAIVEQPTQTTPNAFVPTGTVERVLVSDTTGQVWAYDLAAGELSPFATVSGENFGIEFSPDGALVVADFRGALHELDLVSGAQRELVSGELISPLGLEVLPAGPETTYLVADHAGGIYSYDPRLDELALLVETGGGPRVAVGYDGRVYFTGTTGLAWFDPAVVPTEPRTIVSLPSGVVNGLAHHPNGYLYAMVSDPEGPESVLEIDTATGEVRVVYRGDPFQWIGDGIAGPDGFLYVADAGVPALFRLDPSTGEVETLHEGYPLIDPVDVIIDRSSPRDG